MPARLTSALLVRKGEAQPSGDRNALAGLVQSLPPGGAPARPAASRTPMVELLVPGRAPGAGSGPADDDAQVRLTVRVDRMLHTRLRVLAARQQRTNQDIVQGALEAYLNVFAAGCACVEGAKPKT